MSTSHVLEERGTNRRRWLRMAGATALGAAGGAVVAAAPAAAATGATFFRTTFRGFDSRLATGPISYGSGISIDLISDQDGRPRLPATTVAVTYNLTITETKGLGGFLALWPADQAWPGTSAINWWAPGLTLANGGTTSLGPYQGIPGSVIVSCGGFQTAVTHFVIDVTGYYLPV